MIYIMYTWLAPGDTREHVLLQPSVKLRLLHLTHCKTAVYIASTGSLHQLMSTQPPSLHTSPVNCTWCLAWTLRRTDRQVASCAQRCCVRYT